MDIYVINPHYTSLNVKDNDNEVYLKQKCYWVIRDTKMSRSLRNMLSIQRIIQTIYI